MKGMNVIRAKREIQRDRSQIMVPTRSRLEYEEYCSDEIPKCLTRRNV
jgi:hypothetical protein